MKLARNKKRLTLHLKDRLFLIVKRREIKRRKYLVQALFFNSAQSTDGYERVFLTVLSAGYEIVFLTVLSLWPDMR